MRAGKQVKPALSLLVSPAGEAILCRTKAGDK